MTSSFEAEQRTFGLEDVIGIGVRLTRTAILLVALALVATCQVNDGTRMGGPVVLNTWRVQAGDNLRWAAADFDDSGWRVMPADKQWDELGLGALRGYTWLRARVLVPENPGRLGVGMVLMGPHQVFANGKLIGSADEFPPRGLVSSEVPVLYEFQPTHGHSVDIAIRLWLWPALNRIGRAPGVVRLGRADVMRSVHELAVRQVFDAELGSLFLLLLYTVLAGGLLILFSLQRKQTEYLWLALAILAGVTQGILNIRADLISADNRLYAGPSAILSTAGAICVLEFAFRFLGEKMPRWVRIYQFVLMLNLLRVYAVFHEWIPLADSNVLALLLFIPYWFATPAIVLWRYFRGNKEAGLLAIPLFLMFAVDMSNSLHWSLWRLRLRDTQTPFIPDLNLGLVSIGPDAISHLLFALSVGALILYRFQKVRSEQARTQSELEAARKMQEIMVPAPVDVEGFRIDCVYIPAQEVGGDFYQIFPAEDGSLLVVIGDVSGKGLNAAMLVSFIIGALRRTVQETREPWRLMQNLNEVLAGHTDGRFATCCCALIRADGHVSIANAGHPAPYCEGIEIETPGGIPLGVVSGTEYEQISFEISTGHRLLFLSDGVVEARNQSGELYGFDRTRSISIEPVKRIADIARDFGQEDDITVLGVLLKPVFA